MKNTKCPECAEVFGGITDATITTALVKHMAEKHDENTLPRKDTSIERCPNCILTNADFCVRCGACWRCSYCEHKPDDYISEPI